MQCVYDVFLAYVRLV